MTTVAKSKKRYTQPEIDRALTALILNGGNYQRTEEQLGGPSDTTLAKWRTEHADRYKELQHELAPKIADRIAAEAEELAVMYAEAERKALQVAMNRIDELDPDKAAGAIRNFATAKALQLDKVSSPLRGRPSVITENKGSTDLLRQLAKAAGIHYDAETTATDDTTPQLEEAR